MKRGFRLLAIALALALLLSLCCAQAEASKAAVKAVQQALNELGYDCGTPDGIAGKNTAKAVRDYQAANGLEESGEIDDALLSSLGISATGAKSYKVDVNSFSGITLIDDESLCIRITYIYPNESNSYDGLAFDYTFENRTSNPMLMWSYFFSTVNDRAIWVDESGTSGWTIDPNTTVEGTFYWRAKEMRYNHIESIKSAQLTLHVAEDAEVNDELVSRVPALGDKLSEDDLSRIQYGSSYPVRITHLYETFSFSFSPELIPTPEEEIAPANEAEGEGIVLVDNKDFLLKIMGVSDAPGNNLSLAASWDHGKFLDLYAENRSDRFLSFGFNDGTWNINGFGRSLFCSTQYLVPGAKSSFRMHDDELVQSDLAGYTLEGLDDLREIECTLYYAFGNTPSDLDSEVSFFDYEVKPLHIYPQGKDATFPREALPEAGTCVLRDSDAYTLTLLSVDPDGLYEDEDPACVLTFCVENKTKYALEFDISDHTLNGTALDGIRAALYYRSFNIPGSARYLSSLYLLKDGLAEAGITDFSDLTATLRVVSREPWIVYDDGTPVTLLSPEILAAVSGEP